MSKKLLYKTQSVYLIYSIITLIVAAPLFYYITHKLYIDDAEEALLLRKTEFLANDLPQLREVDIPVWNRFNRDIKILETKGLSNDRWRYTFYYDSLANENEPYRELNAPVLIDGQPYTFAARINLVESEDLMTSIALLFLLLTILLLAGLLFITINLSTTIWRPFYEILRQIEQFEIDKNKAPQLVNTKIEEFNRLNKSINKLIEKNTAIFQGQREFIENAAHELQTPLAVFKAKIDLLIQGVDLSENQAEIIGSLNETVGRLTRLNKNLLLLSKIESRQFNEVANFSINKILADQLPFFKEQSAQQNLSVDIEYNHELSVSANQVLTEILLSNLVMNAIRHNIQNGRIHILVAENRIIISNSGEPKPLAGDNLFGRFSKIGQGSRGNGLGLAIVKKIADRFQWQVNYAWSNDQHQFSVLF